jgi:two-component system KDP operon response regulator KdpE
VRNEIATKLAALDLGADDYVTKPFRLDEFLARVSAVLRRTSNADSSPGKRMKVTSHRRKVNLTYREWHTLRVLMNSPGRVVSPESLLREAGGKGNGAGGGCYQNLHLSLRRKLEPDPRYILLERGLGYRLVEADQTRIAREALVGGN